MATSMIAARQRRADLVAELRVEGVALVGAVQREAGDGVADLVEHLAIGCGGMASQVHCPNMAAIPGVKTVLAIASG